MRVILLFITVITVCYGCNSKKNLSSSKNDLPSADIQIKSALLAAPLEKRDSCTVYGYSADTQLILLRKGTNEMICLADDPKTLEFSVACYVRELEPFMQRGRELRKQGIKDQQLFDEREKEVNAGTLQMPKQPAALYVYSAKDKDFDPATGEGIGNAMLSGKIAAGHAMKCFEQNNFSETFMKTYDENLFNKIGKELKQKYFQL